MKLRRLPPVCSLTRVRALMAIAVAYSLLCGCVTLPATTSFGQEESATGDDRKPPSVEYRRIFVPADNADAWPRGGEKFLPIESREFDAWVAAANRAENRQSPSVTIDEAEYSARFAEDQRLVGRGSWKIELHDGSRAFLPVKTSFAIKDAVWKESSQSPAQLGTWGRHGTAVDDFGLVVSKSGTLEFAWTARAQPTNDGWELPWQLPPATTTRVLLDLPEGQRPHIDGGIVLSSTHVAPSGAAGDTLRRWELRCNPARHGKLRIVGESPARTAVAANISLHDDVVYELTPRGLNMVATWTLTPTAGNPPEELAVAVPRELQLISAVADGVELPWRAVDRANEEQAHVVFRLPPLPKDHPLQIVLRGSNPLVLNRSWKLPLLRPEEAFWASGDVRLAIDPELELRALNPAGCVETGVSNLSGDADHAETWRLAVYSPSASVQLQIARREPDVSVSLGSSLVMADPDITGKLVSRWNVTHGKVHVLSGELAPGWVIETVETDPAEALGEWFIDLRDGRRYVNIQLANAVRPGRGVTAVISGRLPRSKYSDRIAANTMQIVKWQGAQVPEHTLAFETSEPFVVEPIGDLPILAFDSLKADIKSLVDADPASALFFDLSSARETAGLKLTAKRGRFAAEVSLNASLVAQQVLQEHHVVITPTSNRVDRVLIAATRTLGENVRWTDAASDSTISAEQLPVDDPRAAGLPAGSELWLVTLPQPSAKPLEIVTTVSHDFSQRSTLPLLFLPDASEQHGRVAVCAGFDGAPIIDARGMTAVPLPAHRVNHGAEKWPPVRAAFRYDPRDCLESTPTPQLAITRSQAQSLTGLVAQRVVLESNICANGEATHRATYSLRNDSDAPFEWRLPPDAKLEFISVDGRAVPSAGAGAFNASQPAQLVVPAGPSTVTISFITHQGPLSIGDRLAPPLVISDVPLLGGEWDIRLPEEFAIANSDNLNWRQRLFGPLGRPDSARLFQPLRPSNWTDLLNTLTTSFQRSGGPTEPLAGWRSHRINFVAEGPADVRISLPAATTAWAASIFLLSLIGGAWLGRSRKKVLFALLAVAGCMAFLLPAATSPLSAGAVWGLLLSLVVPWPRPRDREISASTHWHRLSTVGAALLIASGCLSGLAFGKGDETADEDSMGAQPQPIHRVLIPVDIHGRRAGSRYYLSEQFARELIRSSATDSASDRRWLLRGIDWQGELHARVEPAGIAAAEFTINCDVEVLAQDTVIVLPFVQAEAAWPASAVLDGIPLPITWREGGHGCTVKIAEPGRYSLVFSLVPRIMVAHGHNVIRLSSQALPGATLRLAQPPDLIGLTVPGAASTAGKTGTNAREFLLDESGRLELQWPATELMSSARSGRVTELEWMRIDDERVELVTKYVFEGNTHQPVNLAVAFDAAWNLVLDEPEAKKVHVIDGSDHLKTIRVEIPASDSERREVAFHWRPAAARPLGRLKLPPIQLVSHSVSQHLRAISSTAAIECEVSAENATSGTAEEFLTIWGENDRSEPPQVVLGTVQPGQPWEVSTRPRSTEPDIAQVLHIAAGLREVSVVYQADIVPGSAHRQSFPLFVPAEASIREIAATQGDRRIPLRWSRQGADRINVFFGERLSEKYRLELRGTVPSMGDERTLPLIAAAETDGTISVQLYRGDEVVLELQGISDDDKPLPAPLESPPSDWIARHTVGYRLDRAAAEKIRLHVQPNQVELAGDSLTTLTRGPNGWACSFQLAGAVRRGSLDGLTLRVPSNWSNSPTLDSSTPASMSIASRDQHGATLSIRFAESIRAGNVVRVRIDSPLVFERGVAIPQIIVKPNMVGQRYLCVPSRLEGQTASWNAIGVQAAELPANLRTTGVASTHVQTFEGTAESFQLTLQPQMDTPLAARVRLADSIVALDPRGGQVMTTRFIIDPQGLAECTLRLPPGRQLVALHLAGQPALAQQVNPVNWRVSLGPPRLPAILEVTTRSSERTTSGERIEIRRPVLRTERELIPVEINLWSVGISNTRRAPAIRETAEATPAEHAVLRFEQFLNTAESASVTAFQLPAPDGYEWYHPWSVKLNQLRREAMDAITKPNAPEAPSRVSQPVQEQLAAASARLDAWIEKCTSELAGQNSDAPLPKLPEGDSPTGEIRAAERRLYCVTDGALDRLTLYDKSRNSRFENPIFGALAIAGLSLAAVVLSRRIGARDVLNRWPHAVGFLLGIAWWAWLWPSWAGLLIAAACVALALRADWPGRATRSEASTVLRASRPK